MVLDSGRLQREVSTTTFGPMEYLTLVVLWIGTGVSLGAWGAVADRLAFLLPCLLVSYLMLALMLRCDPGKLRSPLGYQVCALSALAVAVVCWTASSRMGILGWSLVCLAVQSLAANQERWELWRLSQVLYYFTLSALLIQLLCDEYNTAAWRWMESTSEWLSSCITPLRLRATASGFRIAILGFALLAIFIAMNHGRRNIAKFVGSALSLAMAYMIFIWTFRWMAPAWWHEQLGPSVRLYSKIPSPNPSLVQLLSMYDYVVVFGIVSLLPLIYVARSLTKLPVGASAPVPFETQKTWLHFVAVLAVMLCLNRLPSATSSMQSADAGPLTIGLNCGWDKATPTWSPKRPMGLKYTGMYGIFLDDLNKRGCDLIEIDESKLIESSQLEGLDVVMMMVRTKSVQQIEVDALSQFVRDGGALVLVSDHTNLDGCQEVFDRLAKPYGISSNFDSAFSHRKWWHSNLRCNRSFGMPEIESLNFGIGTGASLNVTGNARPLLVGKFAFGDLGNLFKSSRKEAFLGDYQYQHGEVLSDVIVAATAEFGKGRVVCLGDSSSFQNTMYARSGGFVRHLLGWSTRKLSLSVFSSVWPAILCVLILGVLPLVDWRVGGLVIVPVVCFALSSLAVPRSPNWLPWKQDVSSAICLDISQSNINRDGFTESSYQSLPINLAHGGFATNWVASIDEAVAIKPSCMFLLAPSGPLSKSACKALLAYVEQGGQLIVTADSMTAKCVSPILGAVGISILDQPLGGDLSDPTSGQVKCMNSYGLNVDEAGDVYVERLGTPLIASTEYGRGRIVIVGDSGFFRDANLETEDNGSTLNIQFLHDLCSRIAQGPSSAVWKSPYRVTSMQETSTP